MKTYWKKILEIQLYSLCYRNTKAHLTFFFTDTLSHMKLFVSCIGVKYGTITCQKSITRYVRGPESEYSSHRTMCPISSI